MPAVPKTGKLTLFRGCESGNPALEAITPAMFLEDIATAMATRAPPDMPDLWISVVHAGSERWLADSPALAGVRPQARWGMAWSASGVYGDGVQLARLIGYYRARPPELRQGVMAGDRIRFYAVRVRVQPEAWHAAPLSRILIGEWALSPSDAIGKA